MSYNVEVSLICDGCGVMFPNVIVSNGRDRVTGLTGTLLKLSQLQGWTRDRGENWPDENATYRSLCPECSGGVGR